MPFSHLVLEMLQEPLVKAECRQMSFPDQPLLIGGHEMGGIETQALEHMRRDLGAFLRRAGGKRVQAAHAGRQSFEQAKLLVDAGHASVVAYIPRQRIGINRLPGQWHAIGRILRKQCVQEGCAAAWKACDEDRPIDSFLQNGRGLFFLFLKAQQVCQEPRDIPFHREAAEQAQVGFLAIGFEKNLQGHQKRAVAEFAPPALLRF